MTSYSRVSLLSISLFLVPGCCLIGDGKIYPVKGRVVKGKADMAGSYLLHGIANLDGEFEAIANARVYLAFDEQGVHPVAGYEARTDVDGMYQIDTENIPAATKGYSGYCLVIAKDGYEPIRREMGLRFMSPYLENTAVLKPAKR